MKPTTASNAKKEDQVRGSRKPGFGLQVALAFSPGGGILTAPGQEGEMDPGLARK